MRKQSEAKNDEISRLGSVASAQQISDGKAADSIIRNDTSAHTIVELNEQIDFLTSEMIKLEKVADADHAV